jgi:primosomal protein N' (replication factor Y)
MSLTILQIAIPSARMSSFDYQLPASLSCDTLEPGIRILVPFGRQKKIGILLARKRSTIIKKEKLRPILAILDKRPFYTSHTLELCRWAACYYHTSIGEVLFAALPKALRNHESMDISHCLFSLSAEGRDQLTSMNQRLKCFKLLWMLKQHTKGLLGQCLKEHFSERTIKYVVRKKFVIVKGHTDTKRAILKNFITTPPDFILSKEQMAIISAIKPQLNFQVFLLVGVTGSGKTEVYFQIIQSVLSRGRRILFLIPEIGLTPQTIERFKARFSVPIVIIHSGLTPRAQLLACQQAKDARAAIVIGTRSAIFAPICNLGLIVVDEEHDSSFKQPFGFAYSARDLAVRRGQIENVPVILGSATPSLESLYNVVLDRYKRFDLKNRVGQATLPHLKLINLCGKQSTSGFSKSALEAIKSRLQQKQQVMVFLNRRGFAPKLICHDCSWIPICTHCDIPFVLHKQYNRLCCHHCGRTQPVITHCPQCDSSALWDIGQGTEKLEIRLKKLFPSANILRIDRDNTRRKNSFNNMLKKINTGDADIIVGTQMLAKGHHFPMLTLTIIVDADHGLYSQDFRALEKLGQTLIQVAGRTGRADIAGEVYIQTYYPDHPLLQTLLKKGYHAFTELLLKRRQMITLPPFSYLALLKAKSKTPEKVIDFLTRVAQQLQSENIDQLKITGPFSAAIEKKANYYHAQLWLQSKRRVICQYGLKKLMPIIADAKPSNKVYWNIDVDPVSVF